MRPTLSPHIETLLQQLGTQLAALYGERLHRIVLYGSQARGDATEASDVDVMVVLEGDVDAWTEIQRMSEPALKVELEYEEMITLYPVSRDDFEREAIPVLVNARREGIEV
jgi:predicted nucleotidyltransferase